VIPLRGWLVASLLLASATGARVAAADDADRVSVTTDRIQIVFDRTGASPVEWRACHPACAAPGATSVRFAGPEDAPIVRLALGGAGARVDLQRLRYSATVSDQAGARVVTFTANLPDGDLGIAKTFAIAREGYEVVMTVQLLGPGAAALATGRGLALELHAGRGLVPPPAPGFSAHLDGVSRVAITGGAIHTVGASRGREPLRAGDWAGFRNRFWTLVVRADDASALEPQPGTAAPLVLHREPGAVTARYVFYAGPVERTSLLAADPALGRMILSGLWSWLRPLSLGLLFLLRGLTAVIGHPGPAIIALAACVKVLLLPLTLLAERMQEHVNATQARLQPRIDAIKATLRGEAQARALYALYREEGVHPLYTLKSLAGFLIQLPMFIAVFDMLAEDFDLHGAAFLWIRDLSRPDALLALPVHLPFFGAHLNLLPCLMSGLSITAALRFSSRVLTPSLVRRQRRNLIGMALLFFALFYTFPAGMVLYWTSTNALQLAAREAARRRPGRSAA